MNSSNVVLIPETHKYYVNGKEYPGVNFILQSLNLLDARWFTEERREQGRRAHKLIHYWNEDDLDETSIDPRDAPYLEGWKKFAQERKFIPKLNEVSLFSKHGFCGTLDSAGLLNGDPAVADAKSGMIHWTTGFTTMAYSILLMENFPDLFPKMPKRIAVGLDKTGDYWMEEFCDWKDQGLWLFCVSIFWKNANETGGYPKEAMK